ncbi:MAG: 2-phosphosulfolactate phosphatase [Planctomycetes bacterium]|nr:2-phosphosulfolactate phosphatase [Planctomycetota bacterium]
MTINAQTTCRVTASILPSLTGDELIRDHCVIVVDLLRASSTITAALAAHAREVIPTQTPEAALALKATKSHDPCLLGGERGGILIPGFDLGNSPREYTIANAGGKSLIFTTTNGTAALHHAAQLGAARILIGCLNNLHSVTTAAAASNLPVHVLCAGTHGAPSFDDMLCAGAFLEALESHSCRTAEAGFDQTLACIAAWRHARMSGIHASLMRSTGTALANLGFRTDVADCAAIDSLSGIVGEYHPTRGVITRIV